MHLTKNDLLTTIDCSRIKAKAREYRAAMLDDNPYATKALQKEWFAEAFRREVVNADAEQASRCGQASVNSEQHDREWLSQMFTSFGMLFEASKIDLGKTPTNVWGIWLAEEFLKRYAGEQGTAHHLPDEQFALYAKAVSIVATKRPWTKSEPVVIPTC